MGCSSSTPAAEPGTAPTPAPTKALTFGKDPNLRKEDFIIKDKTGESIVRVDGSIKGQQFIVSDCTDCSVSLLDHSEQVTISRCTDCRIVVAACCTSVFLRDCSNCVLSLAAGQIRLRGCTGLTLLLFAHTRPVIEASTDLRMGAWRLWYPQHAAHMAAAGLEPWGNKFSQVHDFDLGPSGGTGQGVHWTPLSPSREVAVTVDLVKALPQSHVQAAGLVVVGGWRRPLRVWPAQVPEPEPETETETAAVAVAEEAAGVVDKENTHSDKAEQVEPEQEAEHADAAAGTALAAVPPPPAPTPTLDTALLEGGWTPVIPPTSAMSAPPAAMVLLLPPLQWSSAAWGLLSGLCEPQGGSPALAVTRCRPHTLSEGQAGALALPSTATAGVSLGVQVHWVDAANQGGSAAGAIAAAATAGGLPPASFHVVTGDAVGNLTALWFEEWERAQAGAGTAHAPQV